MFNLFDQRFLLHQRGMPLVYTIAAVSALGFTLFGYDQGYAFPLHPRELLAFSCFERRTS
jgi:hypothetical protein